jgi:hypothetical protein
VVAVTDDWDGLPALTTDGHYRVLISRDDIGWAGMIFGTGLPPEGTGVCASTLEDLKTEAFHQSSAGCSNWSYEYSLGAHTDEKLEAFRQAKMALWQAQADLAERGHEIAAELAAVHGATMAEIADSAEVCCEVEAQELVDCSGPRLVGFHSCPHRDDEAREPVMIKLGWWLRGLVDITWDKLERIRDGRR